MPANTAITTETLPDILRRIGVPLNRAARTRQLAQGDPIYFVDHLPYEKLYPFITDVIDTVAFGDTWNTARDTIEDFYLHSAELRDTPIWSIDELALNQLRDEIVARYTAAHPDVVPCYLDRVTNRTGDLRLHVNRTLPVINGLVARSDSPSILAERPGKPTITQQITSLVATCTQRDMRNILLVDSGFASGTSMLQVCAALEAAGLHVVKVIGSIGAAKSRDVLGNYDSECLIWFDLQHSGWVESRDFFMFLNTGTPVSIKNSAANTHCIAHKLLPNGTEIGFAVPYIAYGGRWFRLGDPHSITQLSKRCFAYTQQLYDRLDSQMSISQLAELYQQSGQTFLLPIVFGDLNAQYRQLKPDMPINTYLSQQFSQFIT